MKGYDIAKLVRSERRDLKVSLKSTEGGNSSNQLQVILSLSNNNSDSIISTVSFIFTIHITSKNKELNDSELLKSGIVTMNTTEDYVYQESLCLGTIEEKKFKNFFCETSKVYIQIWLCEIPLLSATIHYFATNFEKFTQKEGEILYEDIWKIDMNDMLAICKSNVLSISHEDAFISFVFEYLRGLIRIGKLCLTNEYIAEFINCIRWKFITTERLINEFSIDSQDQHSVCGRYIRLKDFMKAIMDERVKKFSEGEKMITAGDSVVDKTKDDSQCVCIDSLLSSDRCSLDEEELNRNETRSIILNKNGFVKPRASYSSFVNKKTEGIFSPSNDRKNSNDFACIMKEIINRYQIGNIIQDKTINESLYNKETFLRSLDTFRDSILNCLFTLESDDAESSGNFYCSYLKRTPNTRSSIGSKTGKSSSPNEKVKYLSSKMLLIIKEIDCMRKEYSS